MKQVKAVTNRFVLEPVSDIYRAVVEGSVLRVGLDVGYGFTKTTAWGFAPVLLPTAFGHARDLQFGGDDIAARYPGEQITLDGTDYFVGNLALKQLKAYAQYKMRGRETSNDTRLLMALTAIGKMFDGLYQTRPITMQICTGLPVDHLKRDSSGLRKTLVGRHLIETDRCKFPVEITEVWVIPQPYGELNRHALKPDGSENEYYLVNKASVFDLGTVTFDISTDEAGEPIDAQSGSIEAGVHTIYEALERDYDNEFGERPTNRRIEQILHTSLKTEPGIGDDTKHYNHFKASGEWVDWTEKVATTVGQVRQAALALAQDKVGKAVDIEEIYLVGGPSPLIEPTLKKVYKQMLRSDQSQIANAIGFLHFAEFAAQD